MDALTLDIYKQMPEVSITDILREVDDDTGFTDSFTHIHTGSSCSDKVGLLNVLLAGGINMGLKKNGSMQQFTYLRLVTNADLQLVCHQ